MNLPTPNLKALSPSLMLPPLTGGGGGSYREIEDTFILLWYIPTFQMGSMEGLLSLNCKYSLEVDRKVPRKKLVENPYFF